VLGNDLVSVPVRDGERIEHDLVHRVGEDPDRLVAAALHEIYAHQRHISLLISPDARSRMHEQAGVTGAEHQMVTIQP
jgi:hypothetical protein